MPAATKPTDSHLPDLHLVLAFCPEHHFDLPLGMMGCPVIPRRVYQIVAAVILLHAGLVRAAEPPWLALHSPHFVVITDAGEKKGREIAVRFEQMRSVFGALLLKQRLSQPQPITILALSNDKPFYQAAPLVNGKPIEVPSFMVTADDRVYFVLNLSEAEPWRAVAREFARTYLVANYPAAQDWFDEGVIEYFASIQPDDKTTTIGGDPELALSDAQNKSLTELLNTQPWMPLTDLFAMKRDTTQANSHHSMFSAQSWMLMHYLLHSEKFPDAGTFFDLALNKHVAAEQACTQAFGMPPDQLQKAVQDYFHSLTALQTALEQTKQPGPHTPVTVYQYPAQVTPGDSEIPKEAYRETDVQALIAGIMTRIPERREQGLLQLHALATSAQATPADPAKHGKPKDPEAEEPLLVTSVGNALAHRWLAADEIEHGQFEDAARELGDAAALDQRDVWVRYDISVLKARVAEASHKDIQGIPNMLIDLRTVLESYPDTASAFDLLAMGREAGGGNVAAMQTERTAMQLSPRNQLYPLHLAQIYAAAKQWDASKALLERLKMSSERNIAAQASEMLTQMASNQKFGISGVSTTAKNSQASPFDILNEDAAKRAAAVTTAHTSGPLAGQAAHFLKGRLLSVDCSHPPSAILSVTAGEALFKLRAPDTTRLPVIGAPAFSCDWSNRNVAVNFVPGAQNDGELLSLELR